MRAAPFERYVEPARARKQIWRLVLGLCLVGLTFAAWIAVIGLGLWFVMGAVRLDAALDISLVGSEPVSLLLLLASFAGIAFGTVLAARLLHNRHTVTLIGAPAQAMRDFALGAGVITALYMAALLLWPMRGELVAGLDLRLWLALLPLALLGVLIQTFAEEVLFRGYVQQQLAARFSSALVWMVLPSLIFGLVHYEPDTMGANAWFVVAATGLFGLVAADLTARSGTLGLAWGLHFANNAYALLVISAGTGLDGLALYRFPYDASDTEVMRPMILVDMLLLALVWGACRLALRRR